MATQSARKDSRIAGYDHDDPGLRTGDGGLTIWDLQKMAQEKRLNELNDLFDNGLTMNALPVGVCAGTVARVFDLNATPFLSGWIGSLRRIGVEKSTSHRMIRQFPKGETG